MSRLPITKTPKVYVGGAFIRSESSRVFPINDGSGKFFANVPQCTRKDLRNAVEAAAKAGPGWAKRTAYNRGQILYRLGEMIEARAAEMRDALLVGPPLAASRKPSLDGAAPSLRSEASAGKQAPALRGSRKDEVTAAIDRLIYYAGWADKYEQVLGSVNPVASSHFNFTVTEPMGVIGVIAPDAPALLGLVSLIAPAIVSGNTVVALASTASPYPAILLGEMLATSDLPGGVVNLLTGFRKELLPTFATHTHLRALSAVVSGEEVRVLSLGAAESVKRVRWVDPAIDWFDDAAQTVHAIRETLEFKTTWHPIGA